jgi:hypothetical protein
VYNVGVQGHRDGLSKGDVCIARWVWVPHRLDFSSLHPYCRWSIFGEDSDLRPAGLKSVYCQALQTHIKGTFRILSRPEKEEVQSEKEEVQRAGKLDGTCSRILGS